MTLLSLPQKSCLVEKRNSFWRYAGLGKDSANSVQQRINAARGYRRARPAAHRFAASFTRGALAAIRAKRSILHPPGREVFEIMNVFWH